MLESPLSRQTRNLLGPARVPPSVEVLARRPGECRWRFVVRLEEKRSWHVFARLQTISDCSMRTEEANQQPRISTLLWVIY